MSKIENAFKNGKAFIPFITCGDPSLSVTEEIIYALEESGADIIELGIPFSDPTAEGVTIEAANMRALKQGVTTDKVFDMVAKTKGKVKVPLVFMTYANVLFTYGIERFVIKAKEVGISGIILPDIPYEEKAEFDDICKNHGIDFISLVTPTSNERIKMIAKEANGFVYCVSSLGVTGMRENFNSDISTMGDLVKEYSNVPSAIGFGISNKERALEMSKYADGVIIGSAIVKLCEKYGKDCVPHISEFAKGISEAIK